VVSEVYALNPVAVEPHVVLSLVLFKMVDASPEVREDALHMLHTLSMREWQQHGGGGGGGGAAAGGARGNGLGELHQHHSQQQPQGHLDAGEAADALLALEQDAAAGGGAVLVLGALQDSYQQFQYQLAVKLARCVCVCVCGVSRGAVQFHHSSGYTWTPSCDSACHCRPNAKCITPQTPIAPPPPSPHPCPTPTRTIARPGSARS
jgi:hypothetical protein